MTQLLMQLIIVTRFWKTDQVVTFDIINFKFLTPLKCTSSFKSFTDNLNYHLNFKRICLQLLKDKFKVRNSIYFEHSILVCFPKSDHVCIIIIRFSLLYRPTNIATQLLQLYIAIVTVQMKNCIKLQLHIYVAQLYTSVYYVCIQLSTGQHPSVFTLNFALHCYMMHIALLLCSYTVQVITSDVANWVCNELCSYL